MKTTRWIILAGALTFVSLHGAQAEDKVRLRLNWMYYGSHAGFALGKDKGIYDKHGIDLDIRSGNGSGSAHRLVANGDSTFAYGSCASMINLAAEGAPLDLGRGDRRDGHRRHPGAARHRREDISDLQGQDAAHHRQCRRQHLLPAGAEKRGSPWTACTSPTCRGRAGVELSAGHRRCRRHAGRARRQASGNHGQWWRRAGRPSPIPIMASTRSATASSRTPRRWRTTPIW